MEKTLHIDIRIDEDDTHTLAFAELELLGEHFEATGRAHRNPADRPIPAVGEELALARALQGLALLVKQASQAKIDQFLET